MLFVGTDGMIQLTRGDTARLTVPIINATNNQEYIMSPTDILKFTVKKTVNDSSPCFQKTLTGANQFHILPNDTKELPFGKYLYDVELSTSGGDVYTVVVPSTFEILKEVS